MKTVRLAAAAAVAVAFASNAFASAAAGSAAPGFTLTDLAGKPVNLADYKGKTVVLEWHNFGCPFVQKHYKSGNMQALQKKYGNDVAWLAVNSTNAGHQDYQAPPVLTKALAEAGAAPAKYLMDEPGTMGKAYGAKTTPHMYIIDGTGKVVYNGAIDDNRSANPADVKGAKNFVAVALDEMKAGKPVSTPSTTPYGCTIKYK
jgi:hypothetical protein